MEKTDRKWALKFSVQGMLAWSDRCTVPVDRRGHPEIHTKKQLKGGVRPQRKVKKAPEFLD